MQRFVLYALCALAVALAVWLVSGTGDSGDSVGGPAQPQGEVADLAETPRPSAGAGAQPSADASADELQQEIDAAVRAALGAPHTPGAPAADERRVVRSLGEPPPTSDATGSDAETTGRAGATGSAPQIAGGIPVIASTPESLPAGSVPDSVPAGSVPDSQPDPAPPGETANVDVDADVPPPDLDTWGVQPYAPSGPPEVLSSGEIAQRVEETLPDGSLPPEVLEPAREALAQDILNKSTQAAGWARQ